MYLTLGPKGFPDIYIYIYNLGPRYIRYRYMGPLRFLFLSSVTIVSLLLCPLSLLWLLIIEFACTAFLVLLHGSLTQ